MNLLFLFPLLPFMINLCRFMYVNHPERSPCPILITASTLGEHTRQNLSHLFIILPPRILTGQTSFIHLVVHVAIVEEMIIINRELCIIRVIRPPPWRVIPLRLPMLFSLPYGHFVFHSTRQQNDDSPRST